MKMKQRSRNAIGDRLKIKTWQHKSTKLINDRLFENGEAPLRIQTLLGEIKRISNPSNLVNGITLDLI
jgi:hypothetical protein